MSIDVRLCASTTTNQPADPVNPHSAHRTCLRELVRFAVLSRRVTPTRPLVRACPVRPRNHQNPTDRRAPTADQLAGHPAAPRRRGRAARARAPLRAPARGPRTAPPRHFVRVTSRSTGLRAHEPSDATRPWPHRGPRGSHRAEPARDAAHGRRERLPGRHAQGLASPMARSTALARAARSVGRKSPASVAVNQGSMVHEIRWVIGSAAGSPATPSRSISRPT
jgi:hypothetical protein